MNSCISRIGVAVAASCLMIFQSGCGDKPNDVGQASSSPGMTDQAAHDHPTHGPRGGTLIELGNEEYHAELLHDETTGSVVVHLLDATVKTAVPIEAAALQVNLSHDGDAEQFKLVASPAAEDPPGKASRFVSTDGELGEELDHEHTTAQLVVTILGKQFRGAIAHDDAHPVE